MASLAAGIVDPTKAGKYPVVLSDALRGKDPKELFTGIRYNHKPSLSSSTAPHQARIKPSSASSSTSKGNSYDLSFQNDGGRYAYNGTRGQEENQYVLIFDPDRQVFVLHKVDSMFNMNLVRTPSNTDAESLRDQHPQLPAHKAGAPTKSKPLKEPPKAKKPAPKKKEEKAGLVVPKKAPTKPAPPPKAPTKKPAAQDSEDDSSDDDILEIEDPGGAPPASASRDFSPGFMEQPRRFSEFLEQHNDDSEEDADGEDDDDSEEHFKLPSPLGNSGAASRSLPPVPMQVDQEEESDEDEVEMEDVGGHEAPDDAGGLGEDDDDLEAALMAEMEKDKDESDVSEEE
ncbi:hypothetical protein F5Y15DRAFT_383954 [Xylariaceae sp. FL0016]|nr:hypothetical protein F5Y15DRAFT_383954 [Xylariaceae sp. FL0016]